MDLKRVQELLRLMKDVLKEEHGLAEIEVEDKDLKIRLRKDPCGATEPSPPASPVADGRPSGAAPERLADAPAESSEESNAHVITSPIVGTLYRSPSPDAEHFVEVGDPVEDDTVVCIVEAMKVMNEVKADVTGSILRALVENGKPVQYGQPLFLVST
jgi:acetyl-CoA carboxylase biotin carboxyl carrier protein